jgi:hypothetical protein
MAKYDVIRICGHIEVVQLIGKMSVREWRLENVEPNKLCFECWEAKKIADNFGVDIGYFIYESEEE